MNKFINPRMIAMICIIYLMCGNLNAQIENSSGLDIGFQLSEVGGDFGYGLNLSSPRIFRESVQIRLRANAMLFDYVENSETAYTPYFSFLLGASSATAKISEVIGLYGEGGVAFILPSDEVSSEQLHIGGYGIFGFEFYFFDGFTYFLEAGGVGIEAKTDRLPIKQNYFNGFLTTVGLKVKL